MNLKSIAITSTMAFLIAHSPAKGIQADIDAAYQRIKLVGAMKPDTFYRLPVGKAIVAGPKEAYLRKRTADEILRSNLASGCGDYAITFADLMRKAGYRILLVDGALVSGSSLISTFSGHAVVAVKDPKSGKWWLANPTDRTVLSRNWSTASHNFEAFGLYFWIGYCGPVEKYPAKDGQSLELFYAQTLRNVPKDVLNMRLVRLVFTFDESLKDKDGKLLNPNADNLQKEQTKLFAKYAISPINKAEVVLCRGTDDGRTSVEMGANGRWIAKLGLKSSCSSSLLAYFYDQTEKKR